MILFANGILAQTDPNTLPSTGNVGIGTTTPATKLEVMGTAHIDQSLKVSDSMVVTGDSRVGQDFKVDGNSRTEGNAVVLGELKLPSIQVPSTLNNTELLFVNANSEVIKGGYDLLREQLYKGPINCELNGQSLDLANPFWYNGLNKLFNPCPQVQVGIGTDTPTHGLTVVRDAFVGEGLTVGGFIKLKAPASATNVILVENNTRKLLQLDNSGLLYAREIKVDLLAWPDFVFEKDYNLMPLSEVALFIAKNKHLPNSTATPVVLIENQNRKLYQLNNNGHVFARQIRVNLDATWPDYVFKPEYNLMPLSTLEAYIKENGHLPNIVSAETVAKDGLDLGETNRILMEKVEELTLYLIEQQKSLKLIKTELELLKKGK